MILSVSRRTDIPAFYSDWFFDRIKEGFLYVKNPMNPHQVSEISLSPDKIDCIVFWTKNPMPMMERLEELRDYHYYFQFTLTGYDRDIEPAIPSKKDQLIPAFQRLSKAVGKEKVIWRYDPILLTARYTAEYHIKTYEEMAEALSGYTEKSVISFLDLYRKIEKSTRELSMRPPDECEIEKMAGKMGETAKSFGMEIQSCAEKADLRKFGINHGSCIDKELIQRITGHEIKSKKDKNQRLECGCIESVDVGTYNTCPGGCRYCYANFSRKRVRDLIALFQENSPLLCSRLEEGDQVKARI